MHEVSEAFKLSGVVAMQVEDYFANGKCWWARLREKGGKRHEMPAHHKLERFLNEYLDAAGLRDGGKAPLFARPSAGRFLTERPAELVEVVAQCCGP